MSDIDYWPSYSTWQRSKVGETIRCLGKVGIGQGNGHR